MSDNPDNPAQRPTPSAPTAPDTAEHRRLAREAARERNWKRWGPYLSERQWATVREDYSPDGNVWDYFPHSHARSRVYRWGEDGLLGFSDRACRMCLGVALWNEQDDILKERLFGLTGHQGNHGEDVKESYYYLDSTPTHSYAKALYRYPQAKFPYAQLVEENARRGKQDREYELEDTGVFAENRYFDVVAEYAKAACDDLVIRYTVTNRGPDAAPLHVLPSLWFRNVWSWGGRHESGSVRPVAAKTADNRVTTEHETLGSFTLTTGPAPAGAAEPRWLFTENSTNHERLFKGYNEGPYVKDAFHNVVVEGRASAANPKQVGTKCAAWYRLNLAAGETQSITLRLRAEHPDHPDPETAALDNDAVLRLRRDEADAFYNAVIPAAVPDDQRVTARQAYAGLMWSKQFYYYVMEKWLNGDPAKNPPPASRKTGRNHDWPHLHARDILSMPDKWEYPWFAAWDSAFHMVPFCRVDPAFAKHQLELFLREWYMHPNGQIPAYEFAFGDVNPPVHAWAVWRVYKLTAPRGKRDRRFLASCFQKLLLNFTWWVNQKDPGGRHLFSGGFLGLDNIGVFDRGQTLPGGRELVQADATAWMAFYCNTMLSIALELADSDSPESGAYADMASKFFEHYIAIADAINNLGGDGGDAGLWDERDGIYYDQIRTPDGRAEPIRVRSLVGLMPLIAVETFSTERINRLPGFRRRLDWFLQNRGDLARRISFMDRDRDAGDEAQGDRMMLALPTRDRLRRVLSYLLDENEFLSSHGIRSISKYHEKHPYTLDLDGQKLSVAYTPGESDTEMFGGNSNWRGPIWFPTNYLIIESLERFHRFYGDTFKVECPTGSGNYCTLDQVAQELNRRLATLCTPDDEGRVLFYEYFHGDNGRGLGASHQTGWTALVARCIESMARG